MKLVAYYFSINGNINYLISQLTNRNPIIEELLNNYILCNIYIIVYDKNLTPSQMINNFINLDFGKYSEEILEEKENNIYKLKKYIEQLEKQKEIYQKEFIKFYKEKFELKKKFSLIINKNVNNITNETLNYNDNDKDKYIDLDDIQINYIKKEKDDISIMKYITKENCIYNDIVNDKFIELDDALINNIKKEKDVDSFENNIINDSFEYSDDIKDKFIESDDLQINYIKKEKDADWNKNNNNNNNIIIKKIESIIIKQK